MENYKMLEAEGVCLVEFSHKSWGVVPPNMYINGKDPIDAGYKSPDIEVEKFYMILFINSPVSHRAWVIKVPTRSIIGEHLHKIDCPTGRRLVTSQLKALNRYNNII